MMALAGVTAYAAFQSYTDKVVEKIQDDEVIEENEAEPETDESDDSDDTD